MANRCCGRDGHDGRFIAYQLSTQICDEDHLFDLEEKAFCALNIPPISAGFALSPLPVFLPFLFQLCDGLRTDPNLPVFVETEPEQAAFAARPGSAFLPADLQPKLLLQPFLHALQDALRRPRTGGEYRNVVRIANEAHPSLFQLLVQWIERDVGQ